MTIGEAIFDRDFFVLLHTTCLLVPPTVVIKTFAKILISNPLILSFLESEAFVAFLTAIPSFLTSGYLAKVFSVSIYSICLSQGIQITNGHVAIFVLVQHLLVNVLKVLSELFAYPLQLLVNSIFSHKFFSSNHQHHSSSDEEDEISKKRKRRIRKDLRLSHEILESEDENIGKDSEFEPIPPSPFDALVE